ncbi:hypothetical protein GCM10011365_04090 [Marinicella pacifica]|uniref:Uncharacterized protein n=1 Tax=Marinicella pacifica TaxID=1171543 RepID=A0A917CH32_9GAMM|nr:hypothetical protein GCM10011365_04090 [Marinicella pacifica]
MLRKKLIMNNIKIKNTEYLRPSRTIETILVSNKDLSNIFYVYNYEGVSYRVFKSYPNLISCSHEKLESDCD